MSSQKLIFMLIIRLIKYIRQNPLTHLSIKKINRQKKCDDKPATTLIKNIN